MKEIMRKIYVDFKEINMEDIKGVKENLDEKREKLVKLMTLKIVEDGFIKKPIEVRIVDNKYFICAGMPTYLAAKRLGYSKIPCMIRDFKVEKILRRKINRVLLGEDLYKNLQEDYWYNKYLLKNDIVKNEPKNKLILDKYSYI